MNSSSVDTHSSSVEFLASYGELGITQSARSNDSRIRKRINLRRPSAAIVNAKPPLTAMKQNCFVSFV